jgi:hypothetical protein
MFQVAGSKCLQCAVVRPTRFVSAAEVDRIEARDEKTFPVSGRAQEGKILLSHIAIMQSQDRQRSRVKHHHHVATPPAAVGSPSQVLMQQQSQQMMDIARYYDRSARQIEEE